jgi:3-oxoacyl-[acyl-carrier-protein] synthase III
VNRYRPIVIVAVFALDACTPAQLTTARDVLAAAPADIQAGCADALAAANLASGTVRGGAANTVRSIVAGVVVGCTTAQGIAKLAADASSAEWLGQQAGTLKTITTPVVSGS